MIWGEAEFASPLHHNGRDDRDKAMTLRGVDLWQLRGSSTAHTLENRQCRLELHPKHRERGQGQ